MCVPRPVWISLLLWRPYGLLSERSSHICDAGGSHHCADPVTVALPETRIASPIRIQHCSPSPTPTCVRSTSRWPSSRAGTPNVHMTRQSRTILRPATTCSGKSTWATKRNHRTGACAATPGIVRNRSKGVKHPEGFSCECSKNTTFIL